MGIGGIYEDMHLLTVNAGSSSIRLAAFAIQGSAIQRVTEIDQARAAAHENLLARLLRQGNIPRVTGVAHRIVHGGEKLTAPCLIDAAVEREIERLAPLAPLHNPAALAWIRACRELLGPDIPQAAVFDTAFFAALPKVSAIYALPHALARHHGIRRYGFHGLAHQAMWRAWRRLRPQVPEGGRVISLQLGSGCSVAAIDRGVPRDTSMGFSPLEGLVMATRCGDVDPGALTFLQRAEGLTPEQLERVLNESSGLLGVSGKSGDLRTLLASDDPHARLAIDLYCYRIRKYIGAYLAVLDGAHAVLFGGGAGEHAAAVRRQIVNGMEWCGLRLDEPANQATIGVEGRISAPDSALDVWVVPVDEAAVLAEEAIKLFPC